MNSKGEFSTGTGRVDAMSSCSGSTSYKASILDPYKYDIVVEDEAHTATVLDM